jgi:excisionase family DNA binding protein
MGKETDQRRPARLLLSVEEAGAMLGLGRTKMFELVASGALGSVTIGRRRLVALEEIEAFVERLKLGAKSEASRTTTEARRRRVSR